MPALFVSFSFVSPQLLKISVALFIVFDLTDDVVGLNSYYFSCVSPLLLLLLDNTKVRSIFDMCKYFTQFFLHRLPDVTYIIYYLQYLSYILYY